MNFPFSLKPSFQIILDIPYSYFLNQIDSSRDYLYIFLFHFKKIITKEKKFKIKTICIGNIYLGGTGKTPLTIKIAEVLDKQGIKSVIIKKYRKEHNDEIKLINKSL